MYSVSIYVIFVTEEYIHRHAITYHYITTEPVCTLEVLQSVDQEHLENHPSGKQSRAEMSNCDCMNLV